MKRIFKINFTHHYCLENETTYYIQEYFDLFTQEFFGLYCKNDIQFKNAENNWVYFIAEFKEEKIYQDRRTYESIIKIYQNPEQINESLIQEKYSEYLI